MTDTATVPVEAPDAPQGPEPAVPQPAVSEVPAGLSVASVVVPSARKIAVVGYTNSRAEAPWDDPAFERWICNDLHKYVPDKWDRLYDLHDEKTIASDADHSVWLTKNRKPAYVWDPRPEWPGSIRYPKEEATAAFGRYFTNSISWMIAHAIMECASSADAWAAQQAAAVVEANPGLEALSGVLAGAARVDYLGRCAIHVYGVDMAQGTEYAAQRPSCEYFLGLAAGMGITTFVPLTSDLLKNMTLYGAEDDSAIRAKMDDRIADLERRMAELQNQAGQIGAHINQCQGALEDTRYWKGVWLNAHAERDGSAKGSQPAQSDGQGQVVDLTEAPPILVG